MKTTQALKNIAKIANIVVAILFGLSIFFAGLCLIGFLSINGTNVILLIAKLVSEYTSVIKPEWIAQAYSSCFSGLISGIASAIVLGYAKKYTSRLVADGTPFTFDGSRLLLKVGILACTVPLSAEIIAEIIKGIIGHFIESPISTYFDFDINIGCGLVLILLALVCRSATEQINLRSPQNQTSEYY